MRSITSRIVFEGVQVDAMARNQSSCRHPTNPKATLGCLVQPTLDGGVSGVGVDVVVADRSMLRSGFDC